MKPIEVGKYLVVDPRVCFGKLTFKGTRLPVQTVLTLLAKGKTVRYILESWPFLKKEAIEEAIKLAAAAWPEMMQEEFSERIQLLAASLEERDKKKVKAIHEPAHSGRSA